jgi:hypothetical protein
VSLLTMADAVSRLKAAGLSTDKVEEFMAAFELFDTDRSGRITADKLETVLNTTFGASFTTVELSLCQAWKWGAPWGSCTCMCTLLERRHSVVAYFFAVLLRESLTITLSFAARSILWGRRHQVHAAPVL